MTYPCNYDPSITSPEVQAKRLCLDVQELRKSIAQKEAHLRKREQKKREAELRYKENFLTYVQMTDVLIKYLPRDILKHLRDAKESLQVGRYAIRVVDHCAIDLPRQVTILVEKLVYQTPERAEMLIEQWAHVSRSHLSPDPSPDPSNLYTPGWHQSPEMNNWPKVPRIHEAALLPPMEDRQALLEIFTLAAEVSTLKEVRNEGGKKCPIHVI